MESTPLLSSSPTPAAIASSSRLPFLRWLGKPTSKERTSNLLRGVAKRVRSPQTAMQMSDIIQELDQGQQTSRKQLWIGLFTVANHFIGGILTFRLLEGWPIVDCAYFAVVVTTTVGYGDLTPSHPLTKLYLCYFVVMAVLIISTSLAFFVSTLIEKQEELIMTAIVGPDSASDEEPGSTFPQASRQPAPLWGYGPAWLADYDQVLSTGCILLVLICAGVWIFWYFEQLTLLNSLYVTMISASTVGFGDYGPTRPITRMLMTVWLLLSTVTLAKLVSDHAEAFSRVKQRDATRRLLTARMDAAAFRSIDKNKDGRVDSGEFLGSCLVRLGKVTQADVDEIIQRFKELDKDRSGAITLGEL